MLLIYLSIFGLALAISGAVIVYRYGLPASLFAGNVKISNTHREVNRKAQTGLALVLVGVIAQLSAVLISYIAS